MITVKSAFQTNPVRTPRTKNVASTATRFGVVLAAKHPYKPYYASHGGRHIPPPTTMIYTSVEMDDSTPVISSPGVLDIPFDTILQDTGGFWASGSPTIFTVDEVGLYLVELFIQVLALEPVGVHAKFFSVTDNLVVEQVFADSDTSGNLLITIQAVGLWHFAATDTIQLQAINNGGGGDMTLQYAQAFILQLESG